jgi:hypothetical protein
VRRWLSRPGIAARKGVPHRREKCGPAGTRSFSLSALADLLQNSPLIRPLGTPSLLLLFLLFFPSLFPS